MSTLATNAITDASGGNTATINSYTPTESNMAGRNRIINGDMRIDQRNAGASVTPTNGQYLVDRWQAAANAASKFSVQQSTTTATGFVNSMLATSLSAYSIGAGELCCLRQNIEGLNVGDLGWGTASAQPITVSFWARSSLTGTFGGSIMNGAGNRAYPFTYTISVANTFEYKTVTIAGDTSGTWLTTNGIGMSLLFGLGVGASLSGTAGAWAGASYYGATGATSVVGTSGATFYVTGVQLEAGSVATPFEHRQYGQELALCQRYYEILYNSADNAALWGMSSSGFRGTWYFKVEKRTDASVSLAGASSWAASTPTIFNGISSAAFYNGPTVFYSAGTANTPSLQASAEL